MSSLPSAVKVHYTSGHWHWCVGVGMCVCVCVQCNLFLLIILIVLWFISVKICKSKTQKEVFSATVYIHTLKDTSAPIYFFRKNLVLDNPFKKPPAADQPEPSTSKHSLGRSMSSSASSTTSSSSSGKKSDKAGEKRKARSALDEIMEVRLRMFYTKILYCLNLYGQLEKSEGQSSITHFGIR